MTALGAVAPSPSRGLRTLGCAAAIFAGTGALAHVLVAVSPQDLPATGRMITLAMAALCAWCIPGLWRTPDLRGWVTVAGMYSAMLLIHMLLLHPVLHTRSPDDPSSSEPSTSGRVIDVGFSALHVLPLITYTSALVAIVVLMCQVNAQRIQNAGDLTRTTKEDQL